MSKIKDWIYAFRLRTLFLAVSGVVLGTGLALYEGKISVFTFTFAMLLAISIQILSNLANDLGDFLKGTDTTGKRLGPVRSVQSGKISSRQMYRAVVVTAFFVLTVGTTLVLFSPGASNKTGMYILMAVGVVSVPAALFYTMGRYAYGYVGLGDFFAFLFFGPVAVAGTYFLITGWLTPSVLLPASGLGLVSTMILNVNNMRDIENDRNSGKTTVATMLGLKNAKIYHTVLTTALIVCFVSFSLITGQNKWYNYLYLLSFIFFIKILLDLKDKKGRDIDPFLRVTSLSGLVLALTFSICINI